MAYMERLGNTKALRIVGWGTKSNSWKPSERSYWCLRWGLARLIVEPRSQREGVSCLNIDLASDHLMGGDQIRCKKQKNTGPGGTRHIVLLQRAAPVGGNPSS